MQTVYWLCFSCHLFLLFLLLVTVVTLFHSPRRAIPPPTSASLFCVVFLIFSSCSVLRSSHPHSEQPGLTAEHWAIYPYSLIHAHRHTHKHTLNSHMCYSTVTFSRLCGFLPLISIMNSQAVQCCSAVQQRFGGGGGDINTHQTPET